MKSCFLTLLLTLIVFTGFAQRSDPFTMRLQNLYSGEAIDVYDLRSQEVEGSLYWNEEWSKGTVKLKNGGKVDAFPMRFDLMGQGLEIFLGSETKLLPGSLIEEFYLEAEGEELHHFVSPTSYFGYDGFVDGFFEVLIEGPWTLLRKSEIELLKPNYVVALDAGSTSQTAIRQDMFYLFHEGELIRIPKQKKKAIDALKPHIPTIGARVKVDKINFKQLASLQLLVVDLNASLEDESR
ncbi:MAG: hypothetical protein AAF927_12305 [Bacteroidota bacterium]